MTINQLHYLLAVAKLKNFSKAAKDCHVSQPALSMQIKQLEDEMGVTIFDRSRNPLVITSIGQRILAQAKVALYELEKIKDISKEDEDESIGEIRLGIIPTLAPYLLPLFIKDYSQKYPKVKLNVRELTTDEIIKALENNELDMALMATPLYHSELIETPIFYERMLAYVGSDSSLYNKEYVLAGEIDPKELWLLEEGHCLRTQMLKLCELKKQTLTENNFNFQAGSIETLIRLVDKYQGITILPELATLDLRAEAKAKLRVFKAPVPTREVSLVHHQYYPRKKLKETLEVSIRESLPQSLFEKEGHTLEIV